MCNILFRGKTQSSYIECEIQISGSNPDDKNEYEIVYVFPFSYEYFRKVQDGISQEYFNFRGFLHEFEEIVQKDLNFKFEKKRKYSGEFVSKPWAFADQEYPEYDASIQEKKIFCEKKYDNNSDEYARCSRSFGTHGNSMHNFSYTFQTNNIALFQEKLRDFMIEKNYVSADENWSITPLDEYEEHEPKDENDGRYLVFHTATLKFYLELPSFVCESNEEKKDIITSEDLDDELVVNQNRVVNDQLFHECYNKSTVKRLKLDPFTRQKFVPLKIQHR